jgi:hypothetical protein
VVRIRSILFLCVITQRNILRRNISGYSYDNEIVQRD